MVGYVTVQIGKCCEWTESRQTPGEEEGSKHWWAVVWTVQWNCMWVTALVDSVPGGPGPFPATGWPFFPSVLGCLLLVVFIPTSSQSTSSSRLTLFLEELQMYPGLRYLQSNRLLSFHSGDSFFDLFSPHFGTFWILPLWDSDGHLRSWSVFPCERELNLLSL